MVLYLRKTSPAPILKTTNNSHVGLRLSTLAIGAPPFSDLLLFQVISPASDPPVINGVIGLGSPVIRGDIGRF